jgi:transferase hexapaptide repeat protein
MIYKLKERKPKISSSAFIAKNADVIGDVEIGENASIWFGAVLRGDIEKIVIGKNSNVQDNSTLHTKHGTPCIIGENVSVGHNVILHSCKIGDNVIVGMGSTIMDDAEVLDNCLVGANSLVTRSTPKEEGVLILGSPAKIVRKLTDEEIKGLKANADHYVENGKLYQNYLQEIRN